MLHATSQLSDYIFGYTLQIQYNTFNINNVMDIHLRTECVIGLKPLEVCYLITRKNSIPKFCLRFL